MSLQSPRTLDTKWWEPVIPILEDPDGEGQDLLLTLPLDIRSYLRVLGSAKEAEHDQDIDDRAFSESKLLAAGMKLLSTYGQQGKAHWADVRLQGLRVLEEQAWTVWLGIFCQSYDPPRPYVKTSDDSDVYVSNLRVPLPSHITMAHLESFDQETLDKFTRDRLSNPYHPGMGRRWGEFDLYPADGVRLAHVGRLEDDNLLPVPHDISQNPPGDLERAERRCIDATTVLEVLEAERLPVTVLRLNHCDDPVRILVLRDLPAPPTSPAPPGRSCRWIRGLKTVFGRTARRRTPSE